jgi:alkylation response protein AidB-like acyl-CoA dehydrogenase
VTDSRLPGPSSGGSPSGYEGFEGLRRFRADLVAWLDEHRSDLQSRRDGATLADEVARTRRNQRVLWDAGWLRYGWSSSVGGYGGPPMLRALVAEESSVRQLFYETAFAVAEVLLPTTIAAAPQIAETYGEAFLNGSERWCQGFSEPDAGSDLASLRCRAADGGDHWIVNGQKIWTSYAQFASRMLLLARTGTPESRHRGITAMLIDMDSPGVTMRPLQGMNEEDEFAETFFDNVCVPKTRLIGEPNGGWSVAMDILRSERGTIFWTLSTWLLDQFFHLFDAAELTASDDAKLGHAFVSAVGLRARSWTTQHRMGAGTISTPETSIDKILMTAAEQEIFDLARSTLNGLIEFDDGSVAKHWRSGYMYSRAASIYGGTGEIQRNIVADQVLGLRSLA